ncbi:MAG: class II aldolase/adducin family protein [Armatimonadota bacterium]
MDTANILQELVQLSSNLGRYGMDCVILDEGCVSAKIDDDHFYTKACGVPLSESSPESFVQVGIPAFADLLDKVEPSQEDICKCLSDARIDKNGPYPSEDSVFHAYLLTLPGVSFVGHTHSAEVNVVLCSNGVSDMIGHNILPLEALYCGGKPVFSLEGASPNAVRSDVESFIDKEQSVPKAILMQNHGLIALGPSAAEVESMTAMWVKIMRILAGAYALSGVHSICK